jgi:hypothetical protein
MGKVFEQILKPSDLGMTNSIRSLNTRFARVIKNFDILTDPTKITPYRDMATDTGAGSAVKLCKYLVARTQASDTAVYQYGLGVKNSTDYAKIYYRTLPVGTWDALATAEDTVNRSEDVFIEYKDIIYGWSRVDGSNARVWSYNIVTDTFTSTARSLTSATSVVQGLVHSKDDILYLPYNNVVAKYDGSSWTDAARTLPTDQVITSICEYGNYLAIACKPKRAGGKSTVYLWDRDTSVVEMSEKIDWGAEELELIEELDGYIVGVSVLNNYTGSAYAGTVTNSKVIFKSYGGGLPGTKEILSLPVFGTSSNVIIEGKQKTNNRLYFMMSAEVNGTQTDAIWSVGRSLDGNFVVSIDRGLNNDTAITTCVPKGFQLVGDYMSVAYTDNGTYTANRTASSDVFTSASATYESLILGDSRKTKKLLSVGVMTEPLPTAGQIILKYKADSGSWVTVFTNTTNSSMFHEALNIESTGETLPTYKEIEFQILSTGKAVVTGLCYVYEEIRDRIIDI